MFTPVNLTCFSVVTQGCSEKNPSAPLQESNIQVTLLLLVRKIIPPVILFCDRVFTNRPYSYSHYWTGTSLQWRVMWGNILRSICI